MKKIITIRVFAFIFSAVLAIYICHNIRGLYEWSVWRANGGNPIVLEGVITDVVNRKGRDSGTQFVWIQAEAERRKYDASFDKSMVRKIESLKDSRELVEARHYPTALGKQLIYRLASAEEKTVYFERKLRKDLWQGPVMAVFILLYIGIFLVTAGLSLGFFKPEAK